MNSRIALYCAVVGLMAGFTTLVAVHQVNFHARQGLYRECLDLNRQAVQAVVQKGGPLYSSYSLRCDVP